MMRVNADDWCMRCFEFREFNENGCCVICGAMISTKKRVQYETVDYKLSEEAIEEVEDLELEV